MSGLPSGTITFLFSDIEGSTRMWEEDSHAMSQALTRHDALVRKAIEDEGGHIFKTFGDSFCAAFDTAYHALNAAFAAQQALGAETWPTPLDVRVRMALHTGAAEARDGDYFGPPLNRVARLLSVGYGGQVLISLVTEELVRDNLPQGCTLRSLGEHRLRDLGRSETIFQLFGPRLSGEFPALKTLDNPTLPNNLPLQLTSFIGREKEIGDVIALLQKSSLVTLVGTGGAGKTRLALQVAAEILEEFPDGVWQVELAPVREPDLVARTALQVLGIPDKPGQTLTQALVDGLKAKRLLIVLDNCEHLLPASSQVVSALRRACSGVRVLATSREPLGVSGEQTFRVPSLSLPSPKAAVSLQNVGQFEAVRLFVERAMLVKPNFELTTQNAAVLSQVCTRLDGIPLAIELASARVRTMPVEDINARLDNRFRLLTGGDRSALPRQQTLRALIDWSYELLSESERLLLTRLSVFVGGWTVETAAEVCSSEGMEDWEVFDLLSSLVDKSLVVAAVQSDAARYHLLETVRQYCMERLQESGEAATFRARHRDVFMELAEEAENQLTGPDQRRWLEVLECEHDNLRAALAWSAESQDGAIPGLRIAAALGKFWLQRGYWTEGRQHLERALSREWKTVMLEPGIRATLAAGRIAISQGAYAAARTMLTEILELCRVTGNRAGAGDALHFLGVLAFSEGEFIQARPLLEDALEIYEKLGDKRRIAAVLNNLGNTTGQQEDYAAARPIFEKSLRICREIGDKRGTLVALCNLGNGALDNREYALAKALNEESFELCKELGDRMAMSVLLGNMGELAFLLEDYEGSKRFFSDGVRLATELGDSIGVAYGLEGFASLAQVAGHGERAARLWGAASALREASGAPIEPRDRVLYERQVEQTRSALGDSGFEHAWNEGAKLSASEATRLALEDSPHQEAPTAGAGASISL